MESDGIVAEQSTTRAFEVSGQEVVVQNPDGRVRRQRVPEGINPTVFRHVLAAVDLLWNDEGRFPTPKKVHEFWPTTPLKTIESIFGTDEFGAALEKRGIQATGAVGLTELQATAIAVLTNPGDARSTTSKLKDVGVSYSTFQNWMRQPLFSRLYRDRTERVLEDIVPAAIVGLATNIEAGSQRAIEFGLKMSGRYDPDAVEVQNARTVVLTLVELIQQFVKDPAERKAILDGLEAKMTSIRTVQSLKEIG